ncbi:Phosphopantetheine attachment site [Mycobacteroides abscessus subsp. massiliense]|uniref:acyl carrier protein n=1 Tax=Mycobacteroides abscessus TaxID=36809 RepID=UPI0009CF4C9C|nr:acyl carrier protein [Mycobacteroides abscessus]SKD72116.1 Phosphopantetheine attachment site [Mycobacteroides abscessus subsp. massiliense]SKE27422.1 Phosphopantetheine attachment site [Mycobacteroides abscessus subsp. massiliense]SKE27802.1 Phosphopantetheine attachment site [Mycobacteroides abscessus subsp. massiliense]SKE34071.1 Phosphopantetheine attachment site [Mycobacteroides abscessus subsp. massiliense]SKE44457.1 Phosphopantetheine attachment site [Mycobacteroides abscessus subsp.
MSETTRDRILAAVCEVLYISETELFDGDSTDLRELGLDSVRFVLLMKQLGVTRGSELQKRLVSDLSVASWAQILGQGQPESAT